MATDDEAALRRAYPKSYERLDVASASKPAPATDEEAALRRAYPKSFAKLDAKPAAAAPPAADPLEEARMRKAYPKMSAREDRERGDGMAKPDPKPGTGDLELKLPESAKADDPTIGEFRKTARELGLDSAKAQRLYDLHQRALSEQQTALDTELAQWTASTKADKEVGGPALKESIAVAQSIVNEFGTPGLGQVFHSGFGDHPEVIRLLVRVGKALKAARGSR